MLCRRVLLPMLNISKPAARSLCAAKAPLTEQQKSIVQESWKDVKEIGAEKVGVQLFKNIFEMAPEALQLFSFRDEPDLYNSYVMKWHGSNLINNVGMAVAGIRDPSKVLPLAKLLGKKHDKRGIYPVHFQVAGQALVKTLKEGLGDKFTPEVQDAWVNTYNMLADGMMAEISECKPCKGCKGKEGCKGSE